MKKAFLITLFSVFFTMSLTAQNTGSTAIPNESANVVSLSVGIFNKIKIKYERALTDRVSVGVFANAYYGLYPGFRADPFLRIYISGKAPEGFYLQLKALVGSFSTHQTFKSIVTGTEQDLKQTFFNSGGGIGIGYQFLSGKNKNLAIDLGLGIKLVSQVPKYSQDELQYEGDNVIFYTTGPGSVFDGLISIGVAF